MFQPVSALTKKAVNYAEEMGKADIVVGIPSYNVEDTISGVCTQAARGIQTYFPGCKGLIVVSDGSSTDDTRKKAESTPVPQGIKKITFQYRGIPGKGSALRGIFEMALLVNADSIIVVDADLKSITPMWIELLGKKIIEEKFDLITPVYRRHKYDGTITKNLCYPLTRALYGKRIRQPIGGDFGLSPGLAENLLKKDKWETDVARFGIDIWMTTTAINEGFGIAQARLGTKDHEHKDPVQHLRNMFIQVVGTLFSLMEDYESNWQSVQDSVSIPTYGECEICELLPVRVDKEAMVLKYREGFNEYKKLWERVFPKILFNQLQGLCRVREEEFLFPILIWVKCIYRMAAAVYHDEADKEKLLESLIPLYFGRTAGFVNETLGVETEWVEELIDIQALTFEKMKAYLIQQWTVEG